jgi:heptosyltransferase I
LKILIVKLSAIGDIIHCLPVAAAIKAALPEAHLTWLVDRGSVDLLRNNPCVDEVMTFEGKQWSKDVRNPGEWAHVASQTLEFGKELRKKKFDVALEMQGLFKSGMLALASGAKIRMGFNGTREFAESFLTHRIDVGDYFGHNVPVVELNLKIVSALLKLLGKPAGLSEPVFSLPPLTEGVRQKVHELLASIHIRKDERHTGTLSSGSVKLAPDAPSVPDLMPRVKPHELYSEPICVLIPGTTWVTKIWPTEHWYQLGVELARKYNYRLLIVGARSESVENASLCGKLNSVQNGCAMDLTNKTSLLDLAEIFRASDLVVGGDTGPLHLAAAVGMPGVVGIYGSTPWRRNGPYGAHCRSASLALSCQPCYSKHCKIRTLDCLRNLTVPTVMNIIDELKASYR